MTNSKTNSNRLNNTADRNLLTSMHIMRGLPLTIQTWLNPNYSPTVHFKLPYSSNNSWGRLFLFSHKKGTIVRGKAII